MYVANWSPIYGLMFSDDYYYDERDDLHDKSCKRQVEACDPKEVVLPPNSEYTLIISYPVSTNYTTKLKTGKKGMTRIQLASNICKHYRKMYAEEDSSSGGDPGHIPGMLNRAQSDGKYGIWGHDIGDLVLCSAEVDAKGNITVGVDS